MQKMNCHKNVQNFWDGVLVGAIDDETDLTQAFPLIAVTQVNYGILTVQGNDTDNDGLTDVQETNLYNTDPNNPDTDGDGIQDGTELGITMVFSADIN